MKFGVAAAVAVIVLAAPAGTATKPQEVNVEFSAYGPSQLDVLPGETVLWTNVSQRTHTVTSDTGLFDSGHVLAGGHFEFRFNQAGAYRYHCTIHTSIVGEIDVRRVILGPLPTAAVPVGARVEFTGRAADPSKRIRIQRSLDGSTFTTIAGATLPRTEPGRLRSAPKRPATIAQRPGPTLVRRGGSWSGSAGCTFTRHAPASASRSRPARRTPRSSWRSTCGSASAGGPSRADVSITSRRPKSAYAVPRACGSSSSTPTAGRR